MYVVLCYNYLAQLVLGTCINWMQCNYSLGRVSQACRVFPAFHPKSTGGSTYRYLQYRYCSWYRVPDGRYHVPGPVPGYCKFTLVFFGYLINLTKFSQAV